MTRWHPQWVRMTQWSTGAEEVLDIKSADPDLGCLLAHRDGDGDVRLPWFGARDSGWIVLRGQAIRWESGPPQKMT